MKTNVKNTLMGLILALSSGVYAQNEDDALRYSQYNIIGTARYTGMNGAFTALGGDFSSIHNNPAAAGVFRKTELSYSPYLGILSNEATHYGSQASDVRTIFRTGNFGFIATHEYTNGSSWRNGGFSVSYTKLADFNSNTTIVGNNTESSLLDVYKFDIEQGIFDPYGSDLAWQTYLVDTSAGSVYTFIPVYNQNQQNIISTSGHMRETALTYGANYDDKLYIGGGVGFVALRYTKSDRFTETIPAGDTNTVLNSYSIQNNLTSNGQGVRLNIGLIYRPVDFIRIGLAAHSRTWMSIEDSWTSYVEADFDTFGVFSYDAPIGNFDYRHQSPARYNGGLAVVIKKLGLVSFDYEYVDYASMNLKSSQYAFSNENALIKSSFQAAHNIGAAVEIRLQKISLRAGTRYSGDIYSAQVPGRSTSLSYSGGIGYRGEHFYADFGLLTRQNKQNYYVYDPAFVQASQIRSTHVISSFTLGIRF